MSWIKRQLEAGHKVNVGGFVSMEVTGLDELSQKLDQLQVSNPDNEKKIRNIIRKSLAKAQQLAIDDAHGKLPKDPREAYKAIRKAVYKRVLGGNLNILRSKRSHGDSSGYEPPRTLRPGQRGGNRVPRSARTQQVMNYAGRDRGFILFFLNEGNYKTSPRQAGTRNGRLHGSRGDITARHWFPSVGQKAMEYAAAMIDEEINKLVAKQFG